MRSLELDAYVVGGAVRDELLGVESKDADFLVPGVDIDGLRAALSPHGHDRGARRRRDARWACASTRATGRCEHARRRASSWRRRGARSRPARAATTSRSSSTRRRRSRTTWHGATSRSTRWRAGSADESFVDPYGGRRGPRAAGAAHGVHEQLRRGSAAPRARAAVRLAARPRSRRGRRSRRCGRRRKRVARLGRAHRRRARSGRDGRAVEAAARHAAGEGAADRSRHRRARRAAARVRARDRLRPGEPLTTT